MTETTLLDAMQYPNDLRIVKDWLIDKTHNIMQDFGWTYRDIVNRKGGTVIFASQIIDPIAHRMTDDNLKNAVVFITEWIEQRASDERGLNNYE